MKMLDQMIKADLAKEEFVVATVVDTRGSAPGHVGFRMIITPSKTEGTVGGGALEKAVMDEARAMLAQRKKARLVEYNLSELNMTCGGQACVFFEPCLKKPPLWIFGAGHVARALAPLVSSIGFHLTVVDNREGFAQAQAFPIGTEIKTQVYDLAIADIPKGAFAVIVTHGHAHDEEILNGLAAKIPPLPYIGMIGSKRKVLLILQAMSAKSGIPKDNIYTPIGLKMGGDSAEEIALSIAAEILGVYHHVSDLPHWRRELHK